jgi:O-Antigen ligase
VPAITTTARAHTDSSGRWGLLLVAVLSLAAAGTLMLIGTSLGTLYAVVAVLGVFAVIVVVVNPVFGIVVLVGTLVLGLPWFLAGDGRLTANNLLGLIMLAMLIIQICLTRDLWFLKSPQVILLVLIGAVLLFSLMHARHIWVPKAPISAIFASNVVKDQTENVLFTFFSRLGFLLMFVNFVKSRRHVLLILLAFLVFTMAVIPGAYNNLVNYKGVEDIATGKTIDAVTGKTTEFRIVSDTTSWAKNENRLAFMCNASILLIWLFMQLWKRLAVRVVGFLLILVMSGLILSTASRSGFLCMGMIYLFLLSERGVPWSFRFGVLGAVAFCVLIFFLALPRASYERLLNYSTDQTTHPQAWRSTQSRIETNQHAVAIFMKAPIIGVGPGNFRWLHRELYPYSIAAGRPNHNSFLWAATEGGILTIGLYLALFLFLWRDLRRIQPLYSPDDEMWHVARFLRGFLFTFVFFSAFADFWLEPHLYILTGTTMILLRRLPYEAKAPEPMPSGALAAPTAA